MPSSRVSGFYNWPLPERLDWVARWAGLTEEESAVLRGEAGLSAEQADRMIENVVGRYALPFGIALNFQVNGRDVLVPMVIEEPSVVAGASFAARLAREGGGFRRGHPTGDDRADPGAGRARPGRRCGRAGDGAGPDSGRRRRGGPGPAAAGRRRPRPDRPGAPGDARRPYAGGPPGLRRPGRDGGQRGQHRLRAAGPAGRRNHRRTGGAAHPLQPGGPAAGLGGVLHPGGRAGL